MDGAISGPVLVSFTSEVAFRRPALLLQREGDDELPRLESICTLPPAATTMYCLPPTV